MGLKGKNLLDSYIGRLAVCNHGIIGEAESYEHLPHTARPIWRGHDIINGDSWQALRPHWLDPEREKTVRKALALLAEKEAD